MFSTQTGNIGVESQRLSFAAASEADSEPTDDGSRGDATLEETAERERDYLRRRLRDELQREPSEDELNEWLREHTEGY